MEELVELGSGMASKTRALLYALAGTGSLRRYVPFDVDESVVRLCADELHELYPGLTVHGIVGDFEHDLGRIPAGERRLFALLGGTVGNLHPEERRALLAGVAGLMGSDDRLIVGTDLVKDRATLVAAYDDAEGVTAEFNLNVLRVLNTALDADFDLDAYQHVARFDEEHSWIEMRLRAIGPQHVRIAGADLELDLADGEEIRTEISAKFTPDGVRAELEAAGLELDELHTDDDGLFAVSSARRSG
jgi:L-histidine N-alpha-methyltransferase